MATIFNTTNEVNSLDENDSIEEEPFEANLINSTVYIIAMCFQVSTFAINYRVSCPLYSIIQLKDAISLYDKH